MSRQRGQDGAGGNPEEPAGEPVVLRGHEAVVHFVAFSPDGSGLASGSHDKTARVWSREELVWEDGGVARP